MWCHAALKICTNSVALLHCRISLDSIVSLAHIMYVTRDGRWCGAKSILCVCVCVRGICGYLVKMCILKIHLSDS